MLVMIYERSLSELNGRYCQARWKSNLPGAPNKLIIIKLTNRLFPNKEIHIFDKV